MNLSEILLSIVFYYASVVILGINCINLGLISPIEVVEEWGCHDTEIRLTCGHLDSKLAILEATFTPNCTNEDCLRLDIKRLARAFHTTSKPPVIFSRKQETEAGRKFLEALKNAPHLPNENQEEVVVIDSAETLTEGSSGSSESLESNLADLVTDHLNARKASLRASLEKLIIRYLRKLSPDENFDYEMHKRSTRFKRNMRKKRVKRLSNKNSTENSEEINYETSLNVNELNNTNFNDTENQDMNDDEKISSIKTANLRINLGERVIIVNETDPDELEYEERQRGIKETRQFCPEQRRKVSSLDRFDIEKSFRNESIEDYNIRRLLNRRCSGKNHCSFIFSIDHPFSKVWESGTVRIKYVCMDDFRINHYCGQHLNIGYELSAKEQMEQHGTSSTSNMADEPVVEARVVRESSARDHSSAYHSVKILRADDNLDGLTNLELQRISNQNASPTLAPGAISDSRKRKIKIHNPVIEKTEIKDKGVYSQDFKVLKIIPSDIGDLNDLNKVGDQIYIRKDINDETSSFEDGMEQYHSSAVPYSTTTYIPYSGFPTSPTSYTTHQKTSLPFTKPSPTTYSSSEGTTVLYYPAPNYPETPSNKEIDDNSSWLLGTDEEINSLYSNNGNTSKFENYTITIREGDQYVIVFPTTTTTIPPPLIEDVFLPPDNLIFGKDKTKLKNQTNEPISTTTSYIKTTTPYVLTTRNLDESNQIDDRIKFNKLNNNLSNVDDKTTFLLSSTITTANISAISSTMSIDFSTDLTSPTSTNATTITTTDMTSSTSSESSEFGAIFGMPGRETTTATIPKYHSYGDTEIHENEIEYARPTVGSQLSSSTTYNISSSLETTFAPRGGSKDNNEQNKVIKIDLPDSAVYEEDVENGGFDSFEDENDDDDDYDDVRDLFPTRSTYTSIQKTVFRKPLLHGFIMTPGYPKFYIGEINCKWEISAPTGHKIRLSVLDISLRNPEPSCKDFVEIFDPGTSRTLFNSCAEEIRPIEVITDSHQVNVIVKTTTKFAYPKRGVLLHYSVLGCVDPPLPADGNLVKKTETTNFYECREGYIFADTLTSSRQLVCTERHTWNRILPDCIEELVIAQSGFIVDNYNINSRKRPPEKDDESDHDDNYVHPNLLNKLNNNKNSTIMPDKEADMVFDIIIPTLLIAGLLIVNGFVFAVIIYFRRRKPGSGSKNLNDIKHYNNKEK